MIAARLRTLGLPIRNGIYTIEQLHQSLVRLKSEGGGEANA